MVMALEKLRIVGILLSIAHARLSLVYFLIQHTTRHVDILDDNSNFSL